MIVPDYDTYNTDTELGNVDIYGGKLNFTSATIQANLGRRVRRLEWDGIASDGEAPFVFYIPEGKWVYTRMPLNNTILSSPRLGFLAKYNSEAKIAPYTPNKEDREALDWYVVDPDEDLQ